MTVMGKVVGITGGIGSGKSEFAKAMEALGAARINADLIGKHVLDYQAEVRARVIDTFGHDLVGENNELNRDKLAQRVFKNDEVLSQFNAIIQPALILEIKKTIDHLKKGGKHEIIILDMAILLESGMGEDCDHIVVITAPTSLRIQRVKKTRNWSIQQIEACMTRQWDDTERVQRADTVIENKGSLDELTQKAKDFTQKINKII